MREFLYTVLVSAIVMSNLGTTAEAHGLRYREQRLIE